MMAIFFFFFLGCVCVGTAANGRILTMDNLCKRRLCVIDWCFMLEEW